MGKKRITWDYTHYLKYLKDGRGQGEGAAYKPWITIHDFPSNGICARPMGRKTGRIHHLLSRNEEFYFFLLDSDPDVLDIREQFPLRLSETLELSETLGLKHPRKGSFYDVMTTDFLVTKVDGLHARTIKMAAELANPRVLEKFSIEHAYWERKGIDWKIVTEKEINRDRARNFQWLHAGKSARDLIHDNHCHEQARESFMKLFAEGCIPIFTIIVTIEDSFGFAPGTAVALLKELILDGSITIDLSRRLDRTLASM